MGVNLKMRTRKKVYASEVKTPPSKAKEVPFLFRDDEGDDLEKDAIVEETEVEAAPATSNGGEDVGDGHSDDDDEAPEDVGFSEAKSLALESMAVQKKTKVEVASRRQEKRRLQLERNIQQKEKKLKKITKTGKGEHGGEEGDELSLDFLEKLDEASKIARRNKVKRLDDNNADDEVVFRASTTSVASLAKKKGVSVVAPRDEKGLKRFVAPSVLEFRQRMMFDSRNGKNRREATGAVIRRREKMQSVGKDFARPLIGK